ncbi:CPBP family intramembrane glutamic endopeptidase [uncultured Maricaulis sp.]|uniref:CPBP family intramembrane glutamic endopeptidase n=1 Tax=uncultured Maricaulis sp. TaxID=174710 RepID=UPI0030DA38B2|tara:strand:+ start:99097 stop:99816 length:720 start_codon:yes stop_codon:yes gene_type:complete
MNQEQIADQGIRPAFSQLRAVALIEILLPVAAFFAARWGAQALGLPLAGSIAVVCGVLAATLILAVRRTGWGQAGMRLPTGVWSWLKLGGLIIATMAAIVGTVMVALPAVAQGLRVPAAEGALDPFAYLENNLPLLIAFLVFIAWGVAGFGEEMLFRGFLLGRFETLFGGTRIALVLAVLAQAALFGLGHASQGLYGIVQTGSIGLIMGIAYLAGGRWLWPVIIAHGLVDTISLVQEYG